MNSCLVLLVGALLGGSVERFGDKVRKRLQRLVAIRDAESKSAEEVIRAGRGRRSRRVRNLQRNLEASSFGIGQRLFESQMGGEVLVATSGPAVGAPRRIVLAVDQKLGRTDDSFVVVRFVAKGAPIGCSA